jgi:hypothetical protein
MLILLYLLILLIAINFYQLKTSKPGSDHYIHFGYINSIKDNKHRFVTKINTFINEDDFPDPQLYHWMLSLIPSNFLYKYYKFLGLIFNILSFIFFGIFLNLIYPELEITIDFNMFVLISGLVYILTPFQFFSWNAKSVGLSARGFGVMLGHLFIYCITLYLLTEDFSYLYFSLIFCYAILLSSQFCFQFILFFTFIASILFFDIYIFILPYLSILFFLITFPNWSKVFFIRQRKYKWMYYSILSKKFGLKLRYSIYRDFIYDFFIELKKRGAVRGFEYIYRNPIMELFLGFPFIVLFFLYGFNPIVNLNSPNNIISSIVFISVCIFIITSFRKTRFLGEPQRYIEFVFPIISILAAIYSTSITTIIVVLVFSIMIIIFELVIIKLMAKRNGKGLTTMDKILKLLSSFKRSGVVNNRLISNNFDVLKCFADKDYKIFNVSILESHTSGLHFDEIFPDNYGLLSIDVMIHFVKSSSIDWIILDTNITSKIEFIELTQNKIKVEHNNSIFNYAIYKVC